MQYELWLATDKEFSNVVIKETVVPDNTRAPSWTLPPDTILQHGKTYYWKVRVARAATAETDDGQWSEVMSFAVASLPTEETTTPEPAITYPANNATNSDEMTETPSKTIAMPLWLLITIALLIIALAIIIPAVILSRKKNLS